MDDSTLRILHFCSDEGEREYVVLLDDDSPAEDHERPGFTLSDEYEFDSNGYFSSLPLGYVLERDS